MSTQTQVAGKFGIDLKAVMSKSANALSGMAGFATGHLAFSNMPASMKSGAIGVGISLLTFFLGCFIATKSENENIQHGAIGLPVYSGVKTINGAVGMIPVLPATNGLSGLAENAKKLVSKVFPSLNGFGSIQGFDLGNSQPYNTVDAPYELLNGLNGDDRVLLGNEMYRDAPQPEFSVGNLEVVRA